MKEKIIDDILNLKSGSQFSIGEFLKKYNVTDSKLCFTLCQGILKDLGENIKPLLESKDGKTPIVGLPQNIIYIIK